MIISDSMETAEYRKMFPEKKVIGIEYIYFSRMEKPGAFNAASDIFFPIHFHPDSLSKKNEETAVALGGCNEKGIAVFFAGSFSEEIYGGYVVKSFAGGEIHSRIETRRCLTERCADLLYTPPSFADLKEKMASGVLRDKVVVVDIDTWKIPRDEYFGILAKCAFFLQMAGCTAPLCHNQYESMAAGCVPITEFPAVFFPALEHGKNALVYSGLGGLRPVLLEAVRIAREVGSGCGEYRTLKEGAREYYASYCSFDAFARRIEEEASARIFTLPPRDYTMRVDGREKQKEKIDAGY